jgi:mannose-6-phosphate isomerase
MGILNKISVLKNPVQEYLWGSKTAIQTLLGGIESTERPIAELWMGAHPKASSRVSVDGKWKCLRDSIDESPETILGKSVAERFSYRLPFLLKILAADKPLSIQVHPTLEQAQQGYARENRLGIALDAENRNYRDENHKPEILCALTPFQALKGFRDIGEILGLMDRVLPSGLSREFNLFRKSPNLSGLKHFFAALMTMDQSLQGPMVSEAVGLAEMVADEEPAFHWMVELNREYPEDVGVLSPLLLNFIRLDPGEAIYIQAGELHTYLRGVGVELMANSDNVLRGGLTHKHIDVSELTKIVNFKIEPAKIIKSISRNSREGAYPVPAKEFLLSVISVKNSVSFVSSPHRSVEILICTEGNADVRDMGSGELSALKRGQCIIVPASVSQYGIEGNAVLYKAAVPVPVYSSP